MSSASSSSSSPPPAKPYFHVGVDTIPSTLPPPVLPDPSAPDAPAPFLHPTAVIDDGAEIGKGTRVWHFSHICRGAVLGGYCNVGQNVYIGPGTHVGNHCKIQNNVSLYDGIHIEDQVFLGPSCVFTNDKTPRAVNYGARWFLSETRVKKGTTIGANATIVCGHTLGEYCTIGAGSTVTKDVPAHALMVGVPARQVGWVGRAGFKLDFGKEADKGQTGGIVGVCPVSGERYLLKDGALSLMEGGAASEAAAADAAAGGGGGK